MTGTQKSRLLSAISKEVIFLAVLCTERSKGFVPSISEIVKVRWATDRHKVMEALAM